MNRAILHRTLRQFRHHFLADFGQVTEGDLRIILASSSEMFLSVLAKRYGYTRSEAIGAWNEFVMRRVDGHSVGCVESLTPSIPV